MANVGKVVQVIGPTVDVAFDADKLPRILNAITITDEKRGIRLTIEAALHIGDNVAMGLRKHHAEAESQRKTLARNLESREVFELEPA
jgi:F0F1-type ATP synthase beta subunit